MVIIQTYQGYFQNERFIPSEDVTIPENVEVYVMITGKAIPSVKTEAQRQRQAFEKFFTGIASINDEPITDEDIEWLDNNRINFKREIDL